MLQTQIYNWIKDYTKEYNIKSLVVGVSGGIDSALTSTLCAMTGLPTYCLILPIHQNPSHTERGENHIEWLQSQYDNVHKIKVDLTSTFDTFKSVMGDNDSELGFANSRSRLRMVTLYQVAQSKGGIVIGTGNKVEDYGVGFFTKYGDGGVDISPIGDLTKTQVRELSSILGINQEILDAPPTDGLWDDDRDDQNQIGATYEELEWVMEWEGDTSTLTKREMEVIQIYNSFHDRNKHKMLPIPTFKL